MAHLYAVLTGDFIASTEAGAAALQSSMHVVASVASDIAHWPGSRDTRFTRSRGDGWQLALHNPGDVLRAVFMLHARLRAWPEGIPTRIAVGIGGVNSLGTDTLADAEGPAFTASGQGLQQMGRSQRLTIHFASPFAPFLQSVLSLADERTQHWTREQAEAMSLALQPPAPTLDDMAPRLRISRQAVSYRLSGAGLRAIRSALKGWEDGFAQDLMEGA